jgi:hypothetical protein
MENSINKLIEVNKEIETMILQEENGKQIDWVAFSNLLLISSMLIKEIRTKDLIPKIGIVPYSNFSVVELTKHVEDRKQRIQLLKAEIKKNEIEIIGTEQAIDVMENAIQEKLTSN